MPRERATDRDGDAEREAAMESARTGPVRSLSEVGSILGVSKQAAAKFERKTLSKVRAALLADPVARAGLLARGYRIDRERN